MLDTCSTTEILTQNRSKRGTGVLERVHCDGACGDVSVAGATWVAGAVCCGGISTWLQPLKGSNAAFNSEHSPHVLSR